MPGRLLDHDQALALLRERVREAGGIRAWARTCDASEETTKAAGKTLRGAVVMSPAVAIALGMRKRVMFEVVE